MSQEVIFINIAHMFFGNSNVFRPLLSSRDLLPGDWYRLGKPPRPKCTAFGSFQPISIGSKGVLCPGSGISDFQRKLFVTGLFGNSCHSKYIYAERRTKGTGCRE